MMVIHAARALGMPAFPGAVDDQPSIVIEWGMAYEEVMAYAREQQARRVGH